MTTAYLCGRYLEIYTNRLSQIPKKPAIKQVFPDKTIDDDSSNLYIYQAYHRARQNVKRLFLTNLTSEVKSDIFFTLTYSDNMSDYKRSQDDFNRFRSRCRKVGFDFPYLVISEKQKRGAIHHHGVFFNTGSIDIQVLTKLWSHGYIWLDYVSTDKPPVALAHYMTKYLTKSQEKTLYTKYYRTSYSLKRFVKYTAPLYVPRLHMPYKILHRSQYTPPYSVPIEYSLMRVPEGVSTPSILDSFHLVVDK